MRTAVVLFNRDLRVRDHPALYRASRDAESVVPLFVFDERILTGDYARPNRVAFLIESLLDLRRALRARGANLVVARGDPVREAVRMARRHHAEAVFVTADVSAYAQRRERRLADACARERIGFLTFPGVTVVPPDELTPAGGDHYRVFSPYWRAWRQASWRSPLPAPRRLRVPRGLAVGRIPPRAGALGTGRCSPERAPGGENASRALIRSWGRRRLAKYGERHDDLAGDATSRISPYLHFGCISPLELAFRSRGRPGGEPYVRQLCWRDFHHQVTAAFPAIAVADYRSRGDRWRRSQRDLEAWKEGRTGYPIVDASMRQLLHEGWMHNRARLIVASFLTKHLYLDWRLGARHFLDWLVDGDIANNSGNWQWVAGTGNDTRPNRVFNPQRQAARFDPDGNYVRRYMPELADVEGAAVHCPADLDDGDARDYPAPIVDHDFAIRRFRDRRRRG